MPGHRWSIVLLVVATAGLADSAAHAESASTEPTDADCTAAVAHARSLVAALPEDNMSRRFAESYLNQATAEASGGDFEECLELAERAVEQVKPGAPVHPPGEATRIAPKQ